MKILHDFQGKSVRLTEERLKHVLEHPEMSDMEEALEETLLAPEMAIRSRTDNMVTLNYRFYYKTMVGGKWLCVVVKYIEDDAFVVTAYLTDKPKKGEILWAKT